jgi:heme oxygenase
MVFTLARHTRHTPAPSIPDETPQQALRQATGAAHRRLHLVPSFAALLRGGLSIDGYRQLLLRLLGLHAPLDERQQAFQDEPLLAWARGTPPEARAARLRRDLAALGVAEREIGHVARADDMLPRLLSPAAALGCAWVVEGSALGGRIMAKCLSEHLGIGPENGGAFFAPLPRQEALWSDCCAAVERCGWQRLPRAEMLEAARATMSGFADWMDEEAAV